MRHVRPAVSLPMIISEQRVIYTPSVGEGVVMSPARWMWEKTAHTNESLAPGNLRRTLVHEGGPTAAIPSNVWFAKRHLSWSLKYRNPINAASRRSAGRKAAARWSQLPRKARKQGGGAKTGRRGLFNTVVWSALKTFSQTGILMFMVEMKNVWFDGEEEGKRKKYPFNFLVQSWAVWCWQMSVALRR